MVGLGDTIYARPFLAEMSKGCDVYFETPWPRMFWPHPRIIPVKESQGYRTQRINLRRTEFDWKPVPGRPSRLWLYYGKELVSSHRNVIDIFRSQSGVHDIDFAMPIRDDWIGTARWVLSGREKVVILRPPTVRSEWAAPSRNPRPEFIRTDEELVRDHGYHVIAVGHLSHGEEWLDGVDDSCWDSAYTSGELHWTTIAAMMQISGRVLCSPSFALPMGAGSGASVLTIYGGHTAPGALEHEVMGDLTHVAPDPFCFCVKNGHRDCNKEIVGLEEKVEAWIS